MPELARSRLAELERWISHHNQGHPVPDDVAQALAFARRQLARVDAAAAPRQRAALALPALRATLQASEQEVLAEASGAISEHRSGNLLIKVIDPHGTEIPEVKIRSLRRGPIPVWSRRPNRSYRPNRCAAQTARPDYASIDLSWPELEPRPASTPSISFDRRFNPAALKQDGFVLLRARGLTAASERRCRPTSRRARQLERTQPIDSTQIAPIIKHYKDFVDVWQIEQDEAAWAGLGLDDAGTADIIKAVTAEIRKERSERPNND